MRGITYCSTVEVEPFDPLASDASGRVRKLKMLNNARKESVVSVELPRTQWCFYNMKRCLKKCLVPIDRIIV